VKVNAKAKSGGSGSGDKTQPEADAAPSTGDDATEVKENRKRSVVAVKSLSNKF